MHEEAFEKNFVWYEWTFLSPDDFGGDDSRSMEEVRPKSWDVLEVWDEDHRWPT